MGCSAAADCEGDGAVLGVAAPCRLLEADDVLPADRRLAASRLSPRGLDGLGTG